VAHPLCVSADLLGDPAGPDQRASRLLHPGFAEQLRPDQLIQMIFDDYRHWQLTDLFALLGDISQKTGHLVVFLVDELVKAYSDTSEFHAALAAFKRCA
jgi:hypothetical protein